MTMQKKGAAPIFDTALFIIRLNRFKRIEKFKGFKLTVYLITLIALPLTTLMKIPRSGLFTL